MSSWTIRPQGQPLRGTVHVPGDKSITHRALILGALAEGGSTITGYCRGEDCLNTLQALRSVGIEIQEEGSDRLQVMGKGLWGLTEPTSVIDCGNSGTGMRLLAGVLAGQDFFSVLTGDASLRKRPMGRVVTPLRRMGATIAGRKAGEYAPLAITGGNLRGCEYVSPVASAQVKSSVLLAGLLSEGTTILREPLKSRDHTERMLQYFGVPLDINGLTVSLNGRMAFQGKSLAVPGDISAAAFFLVAGSIVPDSEVLLPRVGVNPERTGILEVLIQMGANIEVRNSREESGEPVADLLVKSAPLRGVQVGPKQVPKTIDELPILCVAAAAAEGETRITGAEELRVKETDRIHAMATELKRLNVQVDETQTGLAIKGKATIKGGNFGSYGDHRVAMSLAVAGLIAQSPLLIDDVACVETSFPGFLDKLLDLLTNSH